MTYQQAIWKLRIEQICMFPFVVLGKLFGLLFPLKKKYSVFLFFPSGDIGGSPQVNLDITHCIKDAQPLIIFSKKPRNNQFRKFFDIEGVGLIDLHPYIDKKIFHFINFFFRGVVATWINKSENPVVFGGETIFFYKIIPHIRKNIPCVELCHLDTWLNYTIGFAKRIDKRIFSTIKLKQDVIRQYDTNHMDRSLYERLYFIDNAIDIPILKQVNNEQTEVVFIGRGSPQKRIHLIAAIAKKMHEAGDKIHFSFVGDVEKIINIAEFPYCKFYGNVSDQVLMKDIYARSDILILTSAFEGLPIVVMTMMSYGKTILSTAVNGIPDYISHMENGLLITETEEDKIIDQGVQLLRLFINSPDLKIKFGKRSREIAIERFSRKIFCKHYRELLLGESS
ncbi:MAG: glycosyltransferase family 4 protein [Bacteroidetes bacterium]|nr:glycosyltransferase family 4 protein [Bacteroidota bacterium]